MVPRRYQASFTIKSRSRVSTRCNWAAALSTNCMRNPRCSSDAGRAAEYQSAAFDEYRAVRFVECSMLTTMLLHLLLTQTATCKTDYGKTECGFDCVADYGVVRCAQTPAGACKADFGQVLCNDPDRYSPGMPSMTCKADYGTIACGYDCVADYGVVRCAQSPAGACKADYGKVVCGDPEHYVSGMPSMSCKAEYGTIACGYQCVAEYGVVRCAKTPQGRCVASAGQVTCWDGEGPPRRRRLVPFTD